MPGDEISKLAAGLSSQPRVSSALSLQAIESILRTLFWVSLKTEEHASLTCSVTFGSPSDFAMVKKHYRDQPSCVPFEQPIDFTIHNVAKLCRASDPLHSSIGICVQADRLVIWGFLDQQEGLQSILTYEKSHAPVTTGLFQVQIVGVGRLVVHCDLELIGELDGEVTNLQIDALRRGPLAAKFTASLQKRYESIRNSLLQSAYPQAVLRRERVYYQWRDVLRRVLYRAKEFRHGAAFILTNRRRVAAINCKYNLSYSMLSEHFEHMIYNGCLEHASGRSITDDSIPALESRGRAVERRFYSSWGEDAERALASSIFFVATLSRVDGVVLLDKSLTVLGFGGEIRSTSDAACQIVRVRSNPGSAGRPVYEPIDITTFGQRHRSMARYCSIDRSAVGFVISSDGPVRAFMWQGSRLLMWDHIQLLASFGEKVVHLVNRS